MLDKKLVQNKKNCTIRVVVVPGRGSINPRGDNAIRIYFESEQNRDDYLAMETHGSGDLSGLRGIFDAMADNPNTGSIN